MSAFASNGLSCKDRISRIPMQAGNMLPASRSGAGQAALVILGLGILLWSAGPVLAQSHNSAGAGDSPITRAQEAFDALPDPDRRAIQSGLVWSGDYKGGIDGRFGRMTFNAIRDFQARRRGPKNGILSSRQISALSAIEQRNVTAYGFRRIFEPRSGITMALPMKLFTSRRNRPSGAFYQARNRTISVTTFRIDERQQDLAALYASLRAPRKGQRITYRVLRDNFLVVSKQTRTAISYTRVARRNDRGATILRGFTLSYARARRAQYDALAIAISNNFDPFARVRRPQPANGNQARDDNVRPDNPLQLRPQPSLIAGTAIAIAPNRYVTVLPATCARPQIGGTAATVLAHDRTTGLAILQASLGGILPLQARWARNTDDTAFYALFAEPDPVAGKPQISLARGAQANAAAGNMRLRIAVPRTSGGGLVIAESGHIAGLLAPAKPLQTASSAAPPPLSRTIVSAGQVTALLSAAGITVAPASDPTAKPTGTSPTGQKTGSAIASAAAYARSLVALQCVHAGNSNN